MDCFIAADVVGGEGSCFISGSIRSEFLDLVPVVYSGLGCVGASIGGGVGPLVVASASHGIYEWACGGVGSCLFIAPFNVESDGVYFKGSFPFDEDLVSGLAGGFVVGPVYAEGFAAVASASSKGIACAGVASWTGGGAVCCGVSATAGGVGLGAGIGASGFGGIIPSIGFVALVLVASVGSRVF